MRIFRTWSEVPEPLKGGVIALGNFDGVHLGHQAVIGQALSRARAAGVAAAVMTFEPHPRMFFKPDQEPFRLSPFRIKARLIEALGVDYLYVPTFDREFSQRSAENFVDEILSGGLKVSEVVVGSDYVFGHQRRGNLALLKTRAAADGFKVTAVEEQKLAGGPRYSSTNIRNLLKEGRCHEAARLLGRYWEIEGRVEHGDARGRELGTPTANINPKDYLRPRFGIYAARAGVDAGAGTVWHNAVVSFGIRPMFGVTDPLLEAHLFDFSGDLYHRHLRVALVEYIRPELKLPDLTALKRQIAEDCSAARRILAAHRFPPSPAPMEPLLESP